MTINRLPKSLIREYRKGFANPDLGDYLSLFDKAIENQGYRILYQAHLLCPCISLNTATGWNIEGGIGSPNPVCPQCKGYGRLYTEEIETKAIIISATQRVREYAEAGKVEMGTVMITPKSEIKLHYFDRFRLIDEELVVNELIKSNSTHTYILQHNPLTIKTVYMYIPNKSNPQASQVLELIFGQDYTVDLQNNKIILQLQTYPPTYNLSILYLGFPYFYIIDLPHHARGRIVKLKRKEAQWLSLPRQGIARRGDLIKL